MNRVDLKERISKAVLLLDGAMGTELIARGIEGQKCNEYLNISSPDSITEIHRSYLAAGSDAVLTNTFGANRFVLARHGLADEVDKINAAGARLARQAAGDKGYVLGDIGPSGDFLAPLGSLRPEELKDAFAEQASGLLAGGVDGFIIETMTALDELTIAIEAVKAVANDLPVFASMAFEARGNDFRTMMGVAPAQALNQLVATGVDAVGFNCGSASLDDYIRLAEIFASAAGCLNLNISLIAEPNAGKPQIVDGRVVYNIRPDDFAAAIERIHSAGVNIIGGCCGTGPAHISAAAKKIKKSA